MLFWVAIIFFAVPLYFYIRQVRAQEKARSERLAQIRSRLQEKKLAEIEQKKQRIGNKLGS